MIEVTGLAKSFGEVVAVADVSFTAEDGAITGLLGPNGAGKTTALRVIAGIVRADRGRSRVDGIDVSARPNAVRGRLGMLPDARGLYPRLSARENVRYFGRLHGLEGEALERRIEALVEMLDLGAVVDRRVEGFSQGERMKVAIARAVVHGPQNVVLDEPTNGLDVMSIRSLREFLRRLRDEGRCVLFSSHVMQEVAVLCDTIVIVAHGRVAASGSLSDLRAATGVESLEDLFVKIAGSEAS
jgi:sodium transport system ATP-binding protein